MARRYLTLAVTGRAIYITVWNMPLYVWKERNRIKQEINIRPPADTTKLILDNKNQDVKLQLIKKAPYKTEKRICHVKYILLAESCRSGWYINFLKTFTSISCIYSNIQRVISNVRPPVLRNAVTFCLSTENADIYLHF